jgi:ABC-type phosphate transport system substrate-binding protein
VRQVKVWRDTDFHVYAEDSASGERFHFHNYAAAMSDIRAIQDITSREIMSSTDDFVAWLSGETMPIFHHSIGLTMSRS